MSKKKTIMDFFGILSEKDTTKMEEGIRIAKENDIKILKKKIKLWK